MYWTSSTGITFRFFHRKILSMPLAVVLRGSSNNTVSRRERTLLLDTELANRDKPARSRAGEIILRMTTLVN
jgi:hypothetical protein